MTHNTHDLIDFVFNSKLLRKNKRSTILEILEEIPAETVKTLSKEEIKKIERKWNNRIKNNPLSVIMALENYISEYNEDISLKRLAYCHHLAYNLYSSVIDAYNYFIDNRNNDLCDIDLNKAFDFNTRESLYFNLISRNDIFICKNEDDNNLIENTHFYHDNKIFSLHYNDIIHYRGLIKNLETEESGYTHGYLFTFIYSTKFERPDKELKTNSSFVKAAKDFVVKSVEMMDRDNIRRNNTPIYNLSGEDPDETTLSLILFLNSIIANVSVWFENHNYPKLILSRNYESTLWIEADDIITDSSKEHRFWQFFRIDEEYLILEFIIGRNAAMKNYLSIFSLMPFKEEDGSLVSIAVFYNKFLENINDLKSVLTIRYLVTYNISDDILSIGHYPDDTYDPGRCIFGTDFIQLKKVDLNNPLLNEKPFITHYKNRMIEDIGDLLDEYRDENQKRE